MTLSSKMKTIIVDKKSEEIKKNPPTIKELQSSQVKIDAFLNCDLNTKLTDELFVTVAHRNFCYVRHL